MRIEIKIERGRPIQLSASVALDATRDIVKGIPEEGLRHPLGIYNVSVGALIAAAAQLLDELDWTSPLIGEEAADRVLNSARIRNATKSLLLANGEHLDACEKVLKCYFSSENGKYAKARRELRSNLAWYDRHIRTQANHIKHRHSQVRNLCLYNFDVACPAYFIESSTGAEAVGPDPLVHGSGNSAFSYARQLKIILCGLFYVSRTLSVIISGGKYAGEGGAVDTPGLAGLIERIAEFPCFMLPDEYGQPYPEVRLLGDHFMISFGRLKSGRPPYGQVNFKTAFGGDGVTRSFQLPYLSGK